MHVGRRFLMAGVGLIAVVVLVLAAPVGGQEITTTTTTTPDVTSTTSTTSTSTTVVEPTTTTAAPRTTVPPSPAVTLPPTTTTVELSEPEGSVPLPTTTSLPDRVNGGDGGISTGSVVLLIIAGLVLMAAVLSFATWKLWRATTPTVAEHG